MKKNIFVLIALVVMFSLMVSSPVSAGGLGDFFKKSGKEIEKAVRPSQFSVDQIKQAGIDVLIGKIKKPAERKEKKADATVDTSIQVDRTTAMDQVDRKDTFTQVTFRSQEEAVTYWNQWYQHQLSIVYDDYRSSCRKNPSQRDEFKQIRDEDIQDLKKQVNEELSRYGNNALLTAPTQM